MYVCFIDFRKAFDSIDRTLLLGKLQNYGVKGRMLRIFARMYESVESCVRWNGKCSDWFPCPFGVRQGCVASSTMFSIFINDLAREVKSFGKHGIQLQPGMDEIYLLLFADDVVLCSDTAIGLQHQLNCLHSYAVRSSLNVNLEKTKIVVFRKGGHLSRRERWKYGSDEIEVVNSNRYLGFDFTTRLCFTSTLSDYSLKAKYRTFQALKALWRINAVNANFFFKLYDVQIKTILLYASEIWGCSRSDIIERSHVFACKKLLNVPQWTPNKMVLGEVGRHPVYVEAHVRCVKYWLRLVKMDSSRYPKKAYDMLLQLHSKGKPTWVKGVETLLNETGFSFVWFHQGVGNVPKFLCEFRNRLIDIFKQNWVMSITSSERYIQYSGFKSLLEREKYLDIEVPKLYKDALARFRLGVSELKMHRYRYLESACKLCPLCKQDNENEVHVLVVCPFYSEIRSRYFSGGKRDYISQQALATELMSIKSKTSAIQMSKYIFNMFIVRSKYNEEE